MFCEKCGNKLLDGERFCSVCGNPVEETESQKKTSDIMAGMGYGVSQEQPSKEASQDFYDDPHSNGKPKKKRKKDDDMEEEWQKRREKRKNYIYHSRRDYCLIGGGQYGGYLPCQFGRWERK